MTKLRFLEQSSVSRKAHAPHCCRFKFRLEISAHAQNIVPVCDVGCAEPPAQFFPLTCQEMKSLHTITYSFILTVTSQNIPDVGTASPPSPKWSNRDKMALALWRPSPTRDICDVSLFTAERAEHHTFPHEGHFGYF